MPFSKLLKQEIKFMIEDILNQSEPDNLTEVAQLIESLSSIIKDKPIENNKFESIVAELKTLYQEGFKLFEQQVAENEKLRNPMDGTFEHSYHTNEDLLPAEKLKKAKKEFTQLILETINQKIALLKTLTLSDIEARKEKKISHEEEIKKLKLQKEISLFKQYAPEAVFIPTEELKTYRKNLNKSYKQKKR